MPRQAEKCKVCWVQDAKASAKSARCSVQDAKAWLPCAESSSCTLYSARSSLPRHGCHARSAMGARVAWHIPMRRGPVSYVPRHVPWTQRGGAVQHWRGGAVHHWRSIQTTLLSILSQTQRGGAVHHWRSIQTPLLSILSQTQRGGAVHHWRSAGPCRHGPAPFACPIPLPHPVAPPVCPPWARTICRVNDSSSNW